MGAEQARSARLSRRRRQGRRSGASTVWCAGHACACGHHARIRLRDGRGCWWRVSTKSASPHRSPVCTDVDGEEVAGSHAWAAWSVLSSCTHARARRVGRGGNERAHTARAIASRGRIGGGARCTPRGRGRRPRGRGRVTGARGSHNDKGAILGGFWDAWKAARKCDFFFCQTRLQSGDKFVISLRAHILRDVARTPSTGPACCGAHHFFGWCPTADVWRERVCVFGECFLNAFCELVF